jgi:predicted transcriptional regulator
MKRPITLTISPETRARLQAEADRQRRSISNLVEIAIDEMLDRMEAKLAESHLNKTLDNSQ